MDSPSGGSGSTVPLGASLEPRDERDGAARGKRARPDSVEPPSAAQGQDTGGSSDPPAKKTKLADESDYEVRAARRGVRLGAQKQRARRRSGAPLSVRRCLQTRALRPGMCAQMLNLTPQCVICNELVFEPSGGPCGHVACRLCLEKWAERQAPRSARCPSCRERIAVAGTPLGGEQRLPPGCLPACVHACMRMPACMLLSLLACLTACVQLQTPKLWHDRPTALPSCSQHHAPRPAGAPVPRGNGCAAQGDRA